MTSPAFFDEDAVVEADVFAVDFVEVVETGTIDVGAADENRGFEFGDGGECAGLADLKDHPRQFGFGTFGLILVVAMCTSAGLWR